MSNQGHIKTRWGPGLGLKDLRGNNSGVKCVSPKKKEFTSLCRKIPGYLFYSAPVSSKTNCTWMIIL